MGDVLPFARRSTTGEHGPLLLTIELYDTPGFSDYVIARHDGLNVDDEIDDVIDRTTKLLGFLHLDRHELTKDPAHDLKITVRVFASSAVTATWMDDDLLLPDGLIWLRRRFGDVYWSLDPRRGVGYYWHIARGKLRNLMRHQPKDQSP